ncbi:MAG: hypothetical protein JW827_07555 [Spirochaetes bacterium]|nr:hypothetical protein [Spirochaetota bacterium]
MKRIYLLLLIILSITFYAGTCRRFQEVYVESDLKPVDGFDQADIQAVAVLNFDASTVKEKDVDKIALRDAIAYDIIRNLYEQKKVRVIQGQAVQSVQEKEMVQAIKGDYETATSTIERLVTYKYNPYQKVDAVLSGKVIDYFIMDEDNPGYNYIEVLVQLVDSVDGTLYWVTKIRGNYKDVIYTITYTVSNKIYTEPSLPTTSLESLPPPTVDEPLD